jgi:predicted ester cyclase
MSDLKDFMKVYLEEISGKTKTEELIEKWVIDPDLKEHGRFFEKAFPKYELIVDEMVEEGNRIAVYGKVRGVHKGELMGIPPTGKEISISLMIIYEVENNQIVNHWMVSDNFALMQQLGVI